MDRPVTTAPVTPSCTRPSVERTCSASRTGMRLTPYSAAMSAWDSSVPGGIAPVHSRSRSPRATRLPADSSAIVSSLLAAPQRADDQPVDAHVQRLVVADRPEGPQHVLDVGVHPRTAGAQLGHPLVDVLAQLVGGPDDGVEQAQLEGAGGGDLLAGGGQPEGLPLADLPRQPGQHQRRCQADADLGEGEAGVGHGDRDVAGGQHPDAEAGRVALDLGDGDQPGAPERARDRDQRLRLAPHHARRGARAPALAAPAERLADRAHPQHVRALGRGLEDADQPPQVRQGPEVVRTAVQLRDDDAVGDRRDRQPGHQLSRPVARPPYQSTSSAAVRTVIARTCVKSWKSSQPPSRPVPLSLRPPQGEEGSSRWWSLTQTIPISSCWATRCARATSRVQIAGPSANVESLASRIASSSSSKGITTTTGPKISWRAISMSLLTSASTVASRKNPSGSPGTSAARPPVTSRAPSATPRSTWPRMRVRARSEMTGPSWVSGSAGSPIRIRRAWSASASTTSSWMLRCTSSRLPAMQVCPAP